MLRHYFELGHTQNPQWKIGVLSFHQWISLFCFLSVCEVMAERESERVSMYVIYKLASFTHKIMYQVNTTQEND